MVAVDRQQFEAMVSAAVEELPQEFRERLANIEFAVEDAALAEDYEGTRLPAGSVLLGVYRGVPLTRRGARYNMALPDRIVIFQRPVQQMARDEEDLRERVGRVVRHEVAHYFGISDDRLREIGAY